MRSLKLTIAALGVAAACAAPVASAQTGSAAGDCPPGVTNPDYCQHHHHHHHHHDLPSWFFFFVRW